MPKKSKAKTETKIKESKEKEPKKLSQTEFEKKVIELSEKGFTAEKIGEKLRRQNIHPKEYSKKISVILKEKNLYESPETKNIGNKLDKIISHLQKNKQDKRAKREKDRIFSQLRKINKYQERKK